MLFDARPRGNRNPDHFLRSMRWETNDIALSTAFFVTVAGAVRTGKQQGSIRVMPDSFPRSSGSEGPVEVATANDRTGGVAGRSLHWSESASKSHL
jgi:hypothetical protein